MYFVFFAFVEIPFHQVPIRQSSDRVRDALALEIQRVVKSPKFLDDNFSFCTSFWLYFAGAVSGYPQKEREPTASTISAS